MVYFRFISSQRNFMCRRSEDGKRWVINSDIVARVTVQRTHPSGMAYEPTYGVTVPAGSFAVARLPRRAPQAFAIRKGLYALPLSLKEKDDAWLAALRLDGVVSVGWTRLRLRVRGYLTKLWRYGKVPSK